ncbi:MarR family winged helix-turn-helix transcriptional regulator [Paenibacillus sp. YIM B09110]|uniref:MarR family winged helix-turn-helix transcriptional regulator n=1 Tax=Paenibacillus sp. YIM B09110 TaxID=3126102 RepID=UPI00301B9034
MKLPSAISFEIKILANMIKRKLDDGEKGLTGMQGWVIGYLRSNADRAVFQRDLERDFNIRRATVTGVLQLMERDGLIVREAVEHDARLKKITLTPKAITLHEQVIRRFNAFEIDLRSGLTEEEIATFFTISEKLKKNF